MKVPTEKTLQRYTLSSNIKTYFLVRSDHTFLDSRAILILVVIGYGIQFSIKCLSIAPDEGVFDKTVDRHP